MRPEKIKIGMKVRISKDISLTRRNLTAGTTMRRMAGTSKLYEINGTTDHSQFGKIAHVNGYVWMPEDLLDDHDVFKEVTLKGKSVRFDPGEM